MAKTIKTAPELERYILDGAAQLRRLQRRQRRDREPRRRQPGRQLGGLAHQRCRAAWCHRCARDICEDAVERLRERYDLVIEIEPEEL